MKEKLTIALLKEAEDGSIASNETHEMKRSEAIERMAKAICASNMAPDCLWECETCDRWKGSDKKAAEAALNALLEGHDGER